MSTDIARFFLPPPFFFAFLWVEHRQLDLVSGGFGVQVWLRATLTALVQRANTVRRVGGAGDALERRVKISHCQNSFDVT